MLRARRGIVHRPSRRSGERMRAVVRRAARRIAQHLVCIAYRAESVRRAGAAAVRMTRARRTPVRAGDLLARRRPRRAEDDVRILHLLVSTPGRVAVQRSRLGVRPLGDFAGLAGLLDHEKVAVGFDDALQLWVLVPGEDEEEPRLFAHALVGVQVDGELVGAAVVGALADEDGLGDRRAVALLEARDVLVDLTKQRLVPGCPLFPQ